MIYLGFSWCTLKKGSLTLDRPLMQCLTRESSPYYSICHPPSMTACTETCTDIKRWETTQYFTQHQCLNVQYPVQVQGDACKEIYHQQQHRHHHHHHHHYHRGCMHAFWHCIQITIYPDQMVLKAAEKSASDSRSPEILSLHLRWGWLVSQRTFSSEISNIWCLSDPGIK